VLTDDIWYYEHPRSFFALMEDTSTLSELMLSADQFCSKIESIAQDLAPTREQEELRLKVAQCRMVLGQLQKFFNENKLTVENASVRGDVRHLVTALLWIAFHARSNIDYKLFRKLVMIESSFTYLLISR
jgi:hypothetical protein